MKKSLYPFFGVLALLFLFTIAFGCSGKETTSSNTSVVLVPGHIT